MKESLEDFKHLIKEWLDTHPKEYGSFIEEMNCKNSVGFQKVFMLIIKYVLKYKDEVKKRMFKRCKKFFLCKICQLIQTFAERLVHEFYNTDRKSIVPAMLAWLYFGRSYECMIEHSEALIQTSKTNRLHKWLLSLMVKYIIHRSILLGERTKED